MSKYTGGGYPSFEDIKARHKEMVAQWGELVFDDSDAMDAHKDRAELIRMVEELQERNKRESDIAKGYARLAELEGLARKYNESRDGEKLYVERLLDRAVEAAIRVAELEAKLEEQDKPCVWTQTVMGIYGDYDNWSTSCGEDFAITEEWHEKPTPYCSNCGRKTVGVYPVEEALKDES